MLSVFATFLCSKPNPLSTGTEQNPRAKRDVYWTTSSKYT